MADISIRKVRKSYGKQEVVHGVDLDVADGAFVVILGPSGCGKSTLLRMIAGLEEISQGEIRISDRVVNELEPRERGCAMVFQNYALYPHMTVAENIGYALKVAGMARAERREKVAAVARTVGLQEFLDRKPGQLSGGQRQRVAMARAMIREPEVFLFDEPLSNLDAALRVNMRVEIMQLHQQLDATMVYVTHDQVEAMTMADRIVVLNKGIIEQVGSPLDLYNKPNSVFVAGFIGSPKMNLISGAVAVKHTAATIGIRPEHIALLGTGGDVQGTIVLTEHLGSDSFLHVDAGEAGRLTVRAPGDYLGKPGQAVSLGFDKARIHRFDSQGKVLV